jgi:hypothetical protein
MEGLTDVSHIFYTFLFESCLWQLVYLRTGLLPQRESSFGSLAISILRPLQGEEPPSWTRYTQSCVEAALPVYHDLSPIVT